MWLSYAYDQKRGYLSSILVWKPHLIAPHCRFMVQLHPLAHAQFIGKGPAPTTILKDGTPIQHAPDTRRCHAWCCPSGQLWQLYSGPKLPHPAIIRLHQLPEISCRAFPTSLAIAGGIFVSFFSSDNYYWTLQAIWRTEIDCWRSLVLHATAVMN